MQVFALQQSDSLSGAFLIQYLDKALRHVVSDGTKPKTAKLKGSEAVFRVDIRPVRTAPNTTRG